MYIPTKFKYKKLQKQLYRLNGISQSNYIVNFNCIIIKSLKSKRFTPNQFESFRRVVKRLLKRQGHLKGFFICDLPITEKSLGIRMGKGKGNIKVWCSSIVTGRVLYSFSNIGSYASFFVIRKASKKFPVKTFIKKLNVSNFFLFKLKNFFY